MYVKCQTKLSIGKVVNLHAFGRRIKGETGGKFSVGFPHIYTEDIELYICAGMYGCDVEERERERERGREREREGRICFMK